MTEYKEIYGIGVRLKEINFLDDSYMLEHFYNLIKNTNFEYKETGDFVDGKNYKFFLFIKKPFENGVDGLKTKIEELQKFINDNNIDLIGKIDLHGGLEIN